MQVIAPLVEGSSLTLDELVAVVEEKFNKTFGDKLDSFTEMLRPTSDLIQFMFSQVDTIGPQTSWQLESMELKITLEPKIW